MKDVSLKDMKEEIIAMLAVCFEGEVLESDARICMILPDGQKFSVSVEKDAA